MKKIVLRFIGLSLCLIASVHASDWSTCASNLDDLRRASRDASDIAAELDRTADELRNCRSFPSMYDWAKDGCRSKVSDYNSKLGNLQSELDTVSRRSRYVASACGVDMSSIEQVPNQNAPSRNTRENYLCSAVRQNKGTLADRDLIGICKQYMSESECKKCLQTK
jgi:hypothetical protein